MIRYDLDIFPIAIIATGILWFLIWLLVEWTFRHPNDPDDSEKKKERK